MTHEFLTNKWILGAVSFIIMFAGVCYLWYQYQVAPYEKQAAETAEFVRQWDKNQQVQRKSSAAERTTEEGLTDSDTPNRVKQINNPTLVSEDIEPTHTQTQSPTETSSVENGEAAEVRMSPHGFGPYPKVPDDYPGYIEWERNPDNPSRTHELMSRVFVKLWTEGERNFRGGSTYKGRILPHYNDVVYVNWREHRKSDGTIVRRAGTKISGPRVNYSGIDFLNPPPHIRVLDLATSGIDPYQYLDLPYKEKE